MTKIELAKKAVNIVVSVGTGRIIGQVIKSNTHPETTVDVVTMAAGAYALGGLVAAETSKYTDGQIDAAVQWWNDNVKKN